MSLLSASVRSRTCAARVGLYVLLACPAAALANGPQIGFDAGGIFPLRSRDIQLVSETVTVQVGGHGRARCDYTLKNLTAEPRTVQMGFVTGSVFSFDPHTYADLYRAAEVNVSRSGDTLTMGELSVRMEELDNIRWRDIVPSPPDSLPVWEVRFDPNETVNLTITYETQWSGGCVGRDCRFGITYYARAASLWAGPVENASVRFEFDKLAALLMACHPDPTNCLNVSATPGSYTRFPWGFFWYMQNWEPAEDFNVSVQWAEPE